MEDLAFKKDETPYLIFACSKCEEFSYVKTTQKTKKCLRCGRTHQVRNILNDGEVVNGMTETVNTVKRKQNEIAIPEFRSGSDFVIATHSGIRPNSFRLKSNVIELKEGDQEIDYSGKFNDMLLELSKLYKRFPEYLLEIKTDDYGIPKSELMFLIRNAIESGDLIKNEGDDKYYRYRKK